MTKDVFRSVGVPVAEVLVLGIKLVDELMEEDVNKEELDMLVDVVA